MNNNERLSIFSEELSYISDPIIRDFVCHCLCNVPEYFFHVPASSSGKYHPSYALGEGGLVRHTKAAVKIYHDLIPSDIASWYKTDTALFHLTDEQFHDAVISALILHDTFKWGDLGTDDPEPEGGHTIHEHPLVAANFVEKQYELAIENPDMSEDTRKTLVSIRYAIASHMGKWVTSKYSTAILPAPNDWLTRVVHLCDLLASRKCIEVKFD